MLDLAAAKPTHTLARIKAIKKEFDIDDVTLSFSFMGVPFLPYFPVVMYFHLFFFETSLYPGKWVNTTPEDTYSTWVLVERDNWHLVKEIQVDEQNVDEYKTLAANSEEFTIPKELFVCQQGCIIFSVLEYWVLNDGRDPGYGSDGAINIYYKVVGEKVILSATDFQ